MYGLYKHCEGHRLTICSGQWKFSFQELTYLWYSVFWYSKRKQNNQHPHPRWVTTHNGLEFNWSQWTGHSSFCFNWKTLILIWNLLNKSSQIYWETLLSSRDLPSFPCSSFWFMGENFIGSVLLCKYLQAFNWVVLIMFYFHSSGLNECTCSAKLSFATLWRKLKFSSPNRMETKVTQSRGTGQAYAALGIRSSTTALEHFYIICALLGHTAGLMQHLTFKGIEKMSEFISKLDLSLYSLLCHLLCCFIAAVHCHTTTITGFRCSQCVRHAYRADLSLNPQSSASTDSSGLGLWC